MASARFRFQPHVERLEGAAGGLELSVALARIARHVQKPVLFDGGLGVAPRASVLAFDPLPPRVPRSLAGLRPFVRRLEPVPGDELPGPFHGGFAGALAYELGAAAEPGLELPGDPWGWPGLVGGLYTDFFVRDDERGENWLVLGENPGDGRSSVAARSQRLRAWLAREPPLRPCLPAGPLERLVSPAEHAARIERARSLIEQGEIYQANLSHRSQRDVSGDPLELYQRLRVLHLRPARQCASRAAPCSRSRPAPAQYSNDAQGSWARSHPIKGTIARGKDPEEDRAQAASCSRARRTAELAMIADPCATTRLRRPSGGRARRGLPEAREPGLGPPSSPTWPPIQGEASTPSTACARCFRPAR
jgi:hypothetical protein